MALASARASPHFGGTFDTVCSCTHTHTHGARCTCIICLLRAVRRLELKLRYVLLQLLITPDLSVINNYHLEMAEGGGGSVRLSLIFVARKSMLCFNKKELQLICRCIFAAARKSMQRFKRKGGASELPAKVCYVFLYYSNLHRSSSTQNKSSMKNSSKRKICNNYAKGFVFIFSSEL